MTESEQGITLRYNGTSLRAAETRSPSDSDLESVASSPVRGGVTKKPSQASRSLAMTFAKETRRIKNMTQQGKERKGKEEKKGGGNRTKKKRGF